MIKIETTTERIESKGGLLLVGKIAENAGLMDIRSTTVSSAGTIITSLFALMTEGKTDFESMGEKRESLFFKEALNLPYVYAKETVRIYLGKMSEEADTIINQLQESSLKIIRQGPLHGLWIKKKQYIPLDIDTTTMDNSKTKKEGVSWTYQGFDGFQPIMAYVGMEGYMLDQELRPGSQHCQNGTADFIKGLITPLHEIKPSGRFLFRLDSGNDAWDTLKVICEGGKAHYLIIKRNKRKEHDEQWLETAKAHGKMTEPREGKKVWVGKVDQHPQKGGESLKEVKVVFEVTEREIDREGNRLLIPEIEVNSWWTNLDCDAEEVIELYHGHATSEQFHAELKDEMDVERLPSGKLIVNKMLLAVAMNAYNALRLLGQISIDNKGRKYTKRKRLGKVIQDFICVAGKLVNHAGSLILKIYEHDPVLPVFVRLNTALDSS